MAGASRELSAGADRQEPAAGHNELSVQDEVALLREEQGRLEQENTALERRLSASRPSALVEINRQLMERLAQAQERLAKVEGENRDFARMYVDVQEQHLALTNLYVASYRLHATLDPEQAMQVIMEILVELVGADEFAIFLLDENRGLFGRVAGVGARADAAGPFVSAGEGLIAEVATSGETFFSEVAADGRRDPGLPLAVIPLSTQSSGGLVVGAIVLYRLLRQKTGFSATDRQILELLAAHAASALVSAYLHSDTERRLRTVEGFMQLMTPAGKRAVATGSEPPQVS